MHRFVMPFAVVLTALVLSPGIARAAPDGVPANPPAAAEGRAAPSREAVPDRPGKGDRTERDEFVAQSRHELNDVRSGIRDLKNRLHAAGAEGRQTFRDDMHELERGLKSAQKHLAGMPAATASAWRKAREELSEEMHRLKEKLKSVKDRAS